MAYVKVNIVSPDGRAYRAGVDDQASYEKLLSDLVKQLELPQGKGPSLDYELALSGALKLTDGVTIRILARHPQIELTRSHHIRLVE